MPHVLSWERIDKKEGKKRAKKRAKKRDKKEEKIEIAIRMLSDGLPIKSIAKYTGLTEKQVNALMH